MQELLARKLHDHIELHHPELLLKLQDEGRVTQYLVNEVSTVDSLLDSLIADNTPGYFIEEQCLQSLIANLGLSKGDYIQSILADEFADDFERIVTNGLFKYELVNLINTCRPIFERFGLTEENQEDWHLRYCIIGAIDGYFHKN